jgi:hypothetical protein
MTNENVRISEKKSEAAKEDRALQARKSNYSQPVNSSVDRILFLQRTIGNQAVGRFIKSGTLQAKLRIGQPDDVYEQEADRVAEQVMRMPEPCVSQKRDGIRKSANIQRKCPKLGKYENMIRKPLEDIHQAQRDAPLEINPQRSSTNQAIPSEVPPIVYEVLSSPSQPLDPATRQFMGLRFGHDFSKVRVHTDVKAAKSTRVAKALAYTIGSDIVFAMGQYAPGTMLGKRLIAHELTHTIQQGSSISNVQAKLETTNPGDALEQDAELATRVILQEGHFSVTPETPLKLARAEVDAAEPTASNGCRMVTETPCPGKRNQLTQIEWFSTMFLVNRGTCSLFVAGLGVDGRPVNPTGLHFELQPGDSGTFIPEDGSVAVGFGCHMDCTGIGLLEHPYLCA